MRIRPCIHHLHLLVALAACSSALVAACPRPTDRIPQIAISRGLEGRLALAPGHAGTPRLKPAAQPNADARARPPHEAKASARRLSATGKPGDWVLENDEVIFVIDGLGGGSGFAYRAAT